MRRMSVFIISAIIFFHVVGYSQPQKGEPCPRPPSIVSFGPHAGPHGDMENALPITLDIADLEKQLSELGVAKPTSDKAVMIVRSFLVDFEKQLIQVQREELNIKEELLKEKPDVKAIRGFVTKKAGLFSDIEYAQIKRDLDIRSLLTPDEYDRWKSLMKKKMHRMLPADFQKEMNEPEKDPSDRMKQHQ